MENLETGAIVEGQFGPVNPTLSPGNPAYAQHTSLGRDKPILQYLHGNADTWGFGAQWFAMAETDDRPEKSIAVLRSWKDRDPTLQRPPRVGFTVGDGTLIEGEWVIASLGEVSYFDPPKHGGGIRGVIVPVTLLEYTKFVLKSEPAPETRYHHAKLGEYFELIAWREYRNAMLGDVIRKRHPDKLSLASGDVVALPSIGAIRTTPVKPASIPFLRSLSLKDSPQKTLKQLVFDRNDWPYVSAIVPEGL